MQYRETPTQSFRSEKEAAERCKLFHYNIQNISKKLQDPMSVQRLEQDNPANKDHYKNLLEELEEHKARANRHFGVLLKHYVTGFLMSFLCKRNSGDTEALSAVSIGANAFLQHCFQGENCFGNAELQRPKIRIRAL
jgi:hypothetical protein